MPKQPSETPFNDPPVRLNGEPARAEFALQDLHIPATVLLQAPLRQLLASIDSIRPDPLEARHKESQPSEEFTRADRDTDIGGVT
jgi:hypothetical protein